MKPALLLLLSITLVAAHAQSIPEQVEAMLLDARYADVIRTVDQQPTPGAILLSKKCEALIMLGNQAAATDLLQQLSSMNTEDKRLPAIIETNYGALDINQGRYEQAIEHLQRALNLFDIAHASNSLEAARTLALLGFAFKSTGKTTQAEQQLLMALTIRKNLLPAQHELIAATYNDLGFVYSDADNDKALEYYDLAAALYKNLHGDKHPKIAITLINTGIIYRKEELYGDAINNFETARTIWDAVYTQPHPQKAFTLLNLGETYMRMGNLPAAIGYYQQARTQYEQTYGPHHPDLAYCHNVIGNVLAAQKKFSEALTHYQQALIANIPGFSTTDIHHNPPVKGFYNGNVLLYSLMYKAQALENQYLEKTLRQADLELGLATLQVCDTLIDKLRKHIANESDKLTLGAISNEVYADGVRMAYILSDVAWRKQPYRELSFYFAEKSKSAILLEAISDANAKSFAKIPATLLDEERDFKSTLALINQKLAQKPPAEEEKQLRESAFTLDRDYQSFIKRLEKQYPEYFNLKYNVASPNIRQLQQRLPTSGMVISYFIDEKNSRLYIYTITHRQFRIVSKTLPPSYSKLITGLRNSITYQEINTYLQCAQDLYRLLMPRIPGSVTDLIILPTGRMSVIPFEALVRPARIRQPDYGKLPYLLQRYSVRYEFSAGLLLQKEQGTTPAIRTALLCAPVTFPPQAQLNDLPGTEAEVTRIDSMFTTRHITSQKLLSGQASETAIKTIGINQYDLIHFATHGVVDEANPELSRIFLQANTTTDDGNLFTGEIYNLELNASLVTLSACQTGLGKISKGEGVIGLSRALVYAGAHNIIVSFWSVADESTAQLMMQFYQNLLTNTEVSYSQNLRQAKLKFLRQEDYAAPFYWAPFILIGY